MIPQPTAAPVVIVASVVDMHGALLLAGVLVLAAAMIFGLMILGLSTSD